MSFNMVTVVWGKMIDWYVDYQMPSLLQPGNLPALTDASYFIYTDEQERISALVSKKITNLKVQVLPLTNGRGNVNDCFKDCASRIQGHLAVIPPDFIFGDGSLKNLAALCEKYDLVVYGFPRCDVEVVKEVLPLLKQNGTVSNAQLVALAMKHLHRETAPPSVCIKRTAKNTWEVRHLVPNPVIKINEKSLALLNSIPANNGLLDHCVPFLCVEAGMSYHYVQSSDEVFLVEPTDRRTAFCPTDHYEGIPNWKSVFARNMEFWKNYWITWRAPESAEYVEEKKWSVWGRLWTWLGSVVHKIRIKYFPQWLSKLCLRIFYGR